MNNFCSNSVLIKAVKIDYLDTSFYKFKILLNAETKTEKLYHELSIDFKYDDPFFSSNKFEGQIEAGIKQGVIKEISVNTQSGNKYTHYLMKCPVYGFISVFKTKDGTVKPIVKVVARGDLQTFSNVELTKETEITATKFKNVYENDLKKVTSLFNKKKK